MCLQQPVWQKTPTVVSRACFCVYKGARYPNWGSEPFPAEANSQRCCCPRDLAAHYGVGTAELNASTTLRSDPLPSPCPLVSPRVV